MNKLIVIVGPTATGKTSLALYLAKLFNGEVISADSRQVYRRMDIGTGKDMPKNSKIKYLKSVKYGYYEIEGIKVWGYDLAEPTEEFSVSHYIKFADFILKNIRKRGKQPILAGGTGLYIKAVIDGIQTVSIPKNIELREKLENADIETLFETLAKTDPLRAASLNASDKNNPRRLIRSIEVAYWKLSNQSFKPFQKLTNKIFIIGLTAPNEVLYGRVEKRVEFRLKEGIENEIMVLMDKGVNWDMQSMNTLGYKEWKSFLTGGALKAEAIKEWVHDEKKYVKRQLTWFKKDSRINWYDMTRTDWKNSVVKAVEKWYKKNR